MRLSIFARLIISYLLLFSMLAGVSLYFIYHLGQFNQITRSIILNDTSIFEYSNQLSDALLSESRYDRKFVVLKDEKLHENYLQAKDEFNQLLNEALTKATSEEMKHFFYTISLQHQSFGRLVNVEMEELHLIHPDMPVVILTAHGSIESAVEAMKRGVFTYLTKPFDSRELILQIDRARKKSQLTGEVNRLKELLEERFNFENIIAKSERMRRVLDQVARIADTESNIAIYGASGTGKELIAKAIHISSQRKDFPFLAINCAAIPESLLESELFGYKKGAFTGAAKNSNGLFIRADKGTIFLDEIGDMPLSIQAKLLRVLQERTFIPLGSDEQVSVDVRIIVATNKNLKEEVKKGNFREDLFYRIHVIPVELPLLKNRKEDIPPLVQLFIKKYSAQTEKKVKSITPAAMQKLMLHDWPGNVRELENSIEYAIAMTKSDTLKENLILKTKDSQGELPTLKEARARFEKNISRTFLKSPAATSAKLQN